MRLFKKSYETYTDEDLMRLFIKGDRRAFEQIYDRYENFILNFFHKKLWQDKEKAADFTHDLFTKIIDKPDAYNPEKPFKTWLFSVANNMCKNEYKKQEVRKPTGYDLPEGVDAKDGNTLQDHELDKNEFSKALQEALNNLNDKHKTVFELRHFQGLALNEIAEVLEISTGTVKSRLHYVTKVLADKLAVYRKIIAE